jgi:hypothetical protein
MRLSASKPVIPLAERGRMLFVNDVRELFGKDGNGQYRKSAWWVRRRFAPELKHRLGRDPYWWESDIAAWMDEQKDVA